MNRTSMTAIERAVVQPSEGRAADLGDIALVWKLEEFDSDGRFAVVEQTIPPRSLAAPAHVHHNEDEYSYVVEGTLGTMLGDEIAFASPRSWVLRPRGQWHALWNPGAEPCRVLEIISPAGFESYYHEVAELFREADGVPELDRFAAINDQYELEMDFESIPDLCHRYGLTYPLMADR